MRETCTSGSAGGGGTRGPRSRQGAGPKRSDRTPVGGGNTARTGPRHAATSYPPPQGGVVSPLLANLFMHYAFDAWMARNHPEQPFERYADDGVVHCQTDAQAESLKAELVERFKECGLELHPTKTRIVYCKDDRRWKNYPNTSFDFLGYTFRPRRTKSPSGQRFVGFTPAVSRTAQTSMRQKIRGWKLYRQTSLTLEELARTINPIVRGWIQYYGAFRKSVLYAVLNHLNRALVRWVRRKFKRLRQHQRLATRWLEGVARQQPALFVHWQLGIIPTVK